ncbi:MAG TPA: SDR family oxidoreductase [Gemmatimonadaceae bacterium]|jgi:rhamnose utilization protein RhaD (predicted bifunctional aldolase and dehydrogenase)/NAD(P)-dependent dehydrogenase (short-subunit alcohol dehydrogenase family)
MTAHSTPARIDDRWATGRGPEPGVDKLDKLDKLDELDELVHLSNLIGQEPRLVQPGGGNTSLKLGDALLVKGSGTDLRTITREGFTRLSLPALASLRTAETMLDADMMRFMASCMLDADAPPPSVETPLHSLLPHRVIAHTHDVATMSLTNVTDTVAERLVTEVFGAEILYVPYVRPGFPLARAVSDMTDRLPPEAIGLALAHHGLVVWGENPRECYTRLLCAVNGVEDYLATRRRGRVGAGPAPNATPSADVRRRCAELVLPVVRGVLGSASRVILHFDDDDVVLNALAGPRMPVLVRRGMATPEHILRAGRLPVWLDIDPSAPADATADAVRMQLGLQRKDYEDYHARHAQPGERPLDDWAKVVLAPGLGMITASRDKRSAVTAGLCYRAVLETMANADAVDAFQFIPEADVFEFEHWQLERRKIDELDARERAALLLPRHVAVVIGGGSGIGQAAAHRFAKEGAHVVVADLDASCAGAVAAEIGAAYPGASRAIGVTLDVRDDASLARLIRLTVLEFGGIDSLFYTAGQAPRFARVTEIRREDLQRQLDVHYVGAVLAIGGAASIMQRQRLGGAIVASVSKAALAPGRDAAAYGGSKAALLQAMRVAAVELGSDGIRINAINADQIETPLFLRFVQERAATRGVSMEEQLEAYRQRNVMGVSLIPADTVADIAALLASDRFRYTTGDIITIDGGLPEAFPR